MDMQKIVDNAVAGMRAESLRKSPQYSLGELLIALEFEQKNDPKALVYFDFQEDGKDMHPDDLNSWRGSYCEIAFEYTGDTPAPSITTVVDDVRGAIGKTYHGYKGGDFLMGRHTPVWVDHWGDGGHRGVVGVSREDGRIIIKTAECETEMTRARRVGG